MSGEIEKINAQKKRILSLNSRRSELQGAITTIEQQILEYKAKLLKEHGVSTTDEAKAKIATTKAAIAKDEATIEKLLVEAERILTR
jgi:hypothetical protein